MKQNIRSLFIVFLTLPCFFLIAAKQSPDNGSLNSAISTEGTDGDTHVDSDPEFDEELYLQLINSNDHTVTKLLNSDIQNAGPRNLSVRFGILTASFCTAGSGYFDSEVVFQRLMKILDYLQDAQRSNGTIDAGGNKQSPPDTAFLLDNLGPAAKVLARRNSEASINLKKRLDVFLLQAGEALLTGGIHTPNHRWVISSALAQLYEIYGDQRYKDRIEEWLAEGIFIDEAGQYPERSRIYSKVVNHSLITIARILGRPELLGPVRKNLETTFFLMEDNGDLVSVDSRRQDQNMTISASTYYWCYRFMAIAFDDSFLAAVARKLKRNSAFDEQVLPGALIHFLETPTLQKKLPVCSDLPVEYIRYLVPTNLVRIGKKGMTATIFGGNDFPLIISSGRSSNPTFFSLRKGEAILEYARLSTSFFNTGYFRSQGVRQEENRWMLHERKEAYYYQPLPVDKQNGNGDYKLSESLDGRFWSKMDFKERSVSNVQKMETNIAVQEKNGEFELAFQIDAPEGVDVTLELCFRDGGKLSNVLKSDHAGDFFFKNGYATYQFGDDTITIGPGLMEHQNVSRIDGEMYMTHFGSVKGKGMHLFLTGRTPFSHVITLK